MRQIKIFIWVLADIFALGILVVSRAPAQKLPPKKERRRLRGGTASALGALKSFAGITLDGEMFTQKDIAAKDIEYDGESAALHFTADTAKRNGLKL